MDSSVSTVNLVVFNPSLLEKVPAEFLWSHKDSTSAARDELKLPPVDLKGFFNGDKEAMSLAAAQIRAACLSHGFFQVVNHGVDQTILTDAQQHMDAFFKLPITEKMHVKRKPGSLCGYSGAHADRFTSNLPWKETFSFTYNHVSSTEADVVNDIKSVLGNDFQEAGYAFQKYCEAMKALAMVIFELLGMSLGVERGHFREFFEDGCSIVRGNNYPPCKDAGLILGTGAHCDPTSLTILHQDEVGGLEIFSDNKWLAIRPCPGAFVINIGDTFMALTNGIYKSCLHRAVVNKEVVRRSLAFFVNPKEDKVVKPPQELVTTEKPRQYPDFTWADLTEFTQNHYRSDNNTLENFVHWLALPNTTLPKMQN